MSMPVIQVPQFKVEVALMRESCGPSWWLRLINVGQRPAEAKIFDETGIIYPMKSDVRDHVIQEAYDWAKFLGVEYDGRVLGEPNE